MFQDTDKEALLQAFTEGLFVSANLTSPTAEACDAVADMPGLSKIEFKPVTVRKRALVQLSYQQKARNVHRNVEHQEACKVLCELLLSAFNKGVVHTRTADLLLRRKGTDILVNIVPLRKSTAPIAAEEALHNRVKHRILPEGKPVDFLIRLGVMTTDGKVVAAKYDKYRQINRFLEMVDDVWPALQTIATANADRPLRIIDFGSGKSYLTFALHHFLKHIRGANVRVTGLDIKQDVIEDCSRIAADLACEDLDFQVGDIAGFQAETADMVVSLHACDTATDDALQKAVGWQAAVILAVPCCQHELYKQLHNSVNQPLLKHGVLKERATALLTDAIRAEWLEISGYKVQVMEFIETAHTPKNLLIRAVRTSDTRPKSDKPLREFCDFWGAQPHLLNK